MPRIFGQPRFRPNPHGTLQRYRRSIRFSLSMVFRASANFHAWCYCYPFKAVKGTHHQPFGSTPITNDIGKRVGNRKLTSPFQPATREYGTPRRLKRPTPATHHSVVHWIVFIIAHFFKPGNTPVFLSELFTFENGHGMGVGGRCFLPGRGECGCRASWHPSMTTGDMINCVFLMGAGTICRCSLLREAATNRGSKGRLMPLSMPENKKYRGPLLDVRKGR